MKSLDVVDFCDQFELKVAKWKKISRAMMDGHYKNGHSYKNKWTLYWVIHPGSKATQI